MPPDMPTKMEQKELDSLVELQIDTWIEEKHLHEVPRICEGNETGEE